MIVIAVVLFFDWIRLAECEIEWKLAGVHPARAPSEAKEARNFIHQNQEECQGEPREDRKGRLQWELGCS